VSDPRSAGLGTAQARPEESKPTAAKAVGELADRFWEGFLERQPLYATFLGDERYDDRLDDPGPAGRAADEAAYREVLEGAAAIDEESLGEDDRVTLDMLGVVARIGLAQLGHRVWQLAPIDQFNGPQTLPGDLARIQRADTPERFDRLIARLERLPAYLQAHESNLDEGVSEARTAAAPVIARVIEQTRRAVETPVDEAPLLVALAASLDEPQRGRLRQTLERTVRPALAHFLERLETYAPHARSGDGLWALADGEAIYRTAILAWTTLDADPQDLHEFGLRQLEAIDQERAVIAAELGYRDAAAVRRSLDSDPHNYAELPKGIVALAEAQIERAVAAAPGWFGRQPRAACVVRAVEPFQEQEAPPAFYLPPTADRSRPGIYYVNTYRPESRPLHQLAARTFHEAVPGHHFQIAIEGELEDLHPFRRHGSRLAGVAYSEGWGLYSERLADEMGLYADARERWGMLDAQAWRAARLVVDTGIHAFRWDRERCVQLLEQSGLSRLEAETETDRYISWPAQALAYMVGQREIGALRRELAERAGRDFDLRSFHDALLGHGAVPLATLRRELPRWLATEANARQSAGPSRAAAARGP
jgi:uncharacterized protein (DUF885 family)